MSFAGRLWNVGKAMWTKDNPSVFTSLQVPDVNMTAIVARPGPDPCRLNKIDTVWSVVMC
jgi:hypothetical protein